MGQRDGTGRFLPGVSGNPNGRSKGVPNIATREFKQLVDDVLFSDPELTKAKLIALRDSDDPTDRRVFWTVVARRLPVAVEAKVEHEATVAIVRRYSSGKVVPLVAPKNIVDPVELPRP